MWNLRHCRLKGVFAGHAGAILGIDLDPDRGVVFTGSADKVNVISLLLARFDLYLGASFIVHNFYYYLVLPTSMRGCSKVHKCGAAVFPFLYAVLQFFTPNVYSHM